MHGYLRHLANFAEVTRAGSITGAAGRLDVSPSVVSNSIKILETHYREPLLERRKDGVVPTTKGHELAEEAVTILDALHRAMGSEKDDAPRGEVRLALPREAVTGWFDAAFRELRRDHPGIHLTLFPDDALEDHTRFARDLYLRIGPEKSYRDLHTLWRLGSEAALVAHPDLLTGGDPSDEEFIATLPNLSPKAASSTTPQSLTVMGASARVELARRGLGMTTCILRSVEDDLRAGRLVRCLPDTVNLPLNVLLGAPQKKPAARVTVVADALRRSAFAGNSAD